jgi:chromosome segregation ATPase
MRIVLKKAYAERFLLFDKLSLDLDNQGLVFLMGSRKHTGAYSSNSSGKTSLLSLVPWIIWGKTLKDTRDVTRVIKFGEQTCFGRVEGEIDDKPFFIERLRSTNRSSEIRTSFTGSSRLNDIQPEINTVFGSFELSQNTVALGQKKALEFLSSKDSDLKKLLIELFGLYKYQGWHQTATNERSYFLKVCKELDTEIKIKELELDKLIIKVAYNSEMLYKESKAAREALQDQVVDLTAKVDEAYKAHELIRVKLGHTEGCIKLADRHLDELRSAADQVSLKLQKSRDESDNLLAKLKAVIKDSKCVTCGQAINDTRHLREKWAAQLGQLEIQIQSLRKTLSEASRAYYSYKNTEYASISGQHEDVKIQFATTANNKERLYMELYSAKRKLKELPRYEDVTVSNDELVDKQKEINILGDLAKSINGLIPYLDFWIENYSPKGIPSDIIAKGLPIITQLTNDILGEWTENHLKLNIESKDVSRTGNVLDNITFKVNDLGQDVYWSDCSQGQERRITVALFLALAMTQEALSGVSWNIRFIDELFDILDRPGIEGIVRILRRMAGNKIPTVVLSSHRNELGDLDVFSKIWIVDRGEASVLRVHDCM